jgi:hypothetical protein
MVLLGDEAHADARFGLFRHRLILTQDRCTVCAERPKVQKSFWTHPMDLLGDIGHVESRFNTFGDTVRVSAR